MTCQRARGRRALRRRTSRGSYRDVSGLLARAAALDEAKRFLDSTGRSVRLGLRELRTFPR